MDQQQPTCPICHAPTDAESKLFPFCSARCQRIDLGNWLGERYVIPGDPATADESPAMEQPSDGDERPDRPRPRGA